MIDVADAIDAEAQGAVLRSRTQTYERGGRLVSLAGDPTPIRVVQQPINGQELMDVQESVREEATFKFYSRTKMSNDDVIEFRGSRYRVLHVWDRQFPGNYHMVAAGLVRND